MQAGAVYIKFFVYLLVYVYLYTRFQNPGAREVLNFIEIHCQIYKKLSLLLVILIPSKVL